MCVIHYPDEDGGIIFIHIPKNAGSSISSYFCQKYGYTKEEAYLLDNPVKTIKHSLGHTPWHEYIKYWNNFFGIPRGAAPYTPARDITKYDILTVVRNPYTRVISDFFWWMSVYDDLYYFGNEEHKDDPPTRDLQYMESFIETRLNEQLNDPDVISGQKHDAHHWPQHWFLYGGAAAAAAEEDLIRNIDDIDVFEPRGANLIERLVIIKKENLVEDFKTIYSGKFADFNLHENKCFLELDAMELLTPKIIRLINNVYERDFELFGYTMLDPEIDGKILEPDFIVRPTRGPHPSQK
jgi:hypothetical protein